MHEFGGNPNLGCPISFSLLSCLPMQGVSCWQLDASAFVPPREALSIHVAMALLAAPQHHPTLELFLHLVQGTSCRWVVTFYALHVGFVCIAFFVF